MKLRMEDLKSKEIINTKNGERLGLLSDIEIDIETGRIISIVVYGRTKFSGILGKDDDIAIPWENIKVIGEDTILVNYDLTYYSKPRKKSKFLKNLID